MHCHHFTTTNLLNRWQTCQVQLRLQLVCDKQEELKLLTLASASGGGNTGRKGGKNICILFSRIWHTLKGSEREWCERAVWGEVLTIFSTRSCKYPEESQKSAPVFSCSKLCQSPAQCTPACSSGWCLFFSRDLPAGAPDHICDILGWRMYLLLFPQSLTSVVSGFPYACPKAALVTAKEQVKSSVI